MIEGLTRKEATIVIIDPHADYVLISLPKDGRKHLFSDRVTVFCNPVSTSRFGAGNVGKVEPYDVVFTDLSSDGTVSEIEVMLWSLGGFLSAGG